MSLGDDGLNKFGTVNLGPLSSLFNSQIPLGCYVACWILALTWLFRRGHGILSKSTSELVEALGVTEPVVPEVVIDSLGDTWVSIYWQYAPPSSTKNRRPKVRKHLIRIGEQLIEAERDTRRALITHLEPNTAYELTVQAVQVAQSEAVNPSYITGTSIPSQKSTSVLPNGSATDRSVIKSVQCGTQVPSNSHLLGGIGTIYLQTLSSKEDLPPPVSIMLRGDPPQFTSEEQERVSDILSIQRNIRDVVNQMITGDTQYTMKYKGLVQELAELNNRRKQDETRRTQLRIENKNLEDENHALEVQISKIRLLAAKIAKYQAESELSSHQTHEIEQNELKQKEESEAKLEALGVEVKELQTKESELLQQMREATRSLKSLGVETDRVRNLISKLKDESPFSSTESKLALLSSSEDAGYLKPSEIDQLAREIQLNSRIEREWAKAQKVLESQYVDAYLRNSELKAQSRLEYQPPSHRQPDLTSMEQGGRPLLRPTPSPPDSLGPAGITGPAAGPASGPASGPVSGPASGSASAPGSMPFLVPTSTNSSQSGGLSTPAGLASTALPPLHLTSPSSLAPPLQPINQLHSNSSMHAANLTGVNALGSGHAYDPFLVTPSPVMPMQIDSSSGGGSTAGAGRFGRSLPSQLNNYPEYAISPTAADTLLPSGLFQDDASYVTAFENEPKPSETGSVSSLSTSSGIPADYYGTATPKGPVIKEDNAEKNHTVSTTKTREGSWLPWLSPQGKSSGNRRTTSLFFGAHSDEPISSSPSDLHGDEEAVEEDGDTSGTGEPNSMSRSPLKNMGSRIFQKSQNRSGGFVRRLSIFSRKEAEQKSEEEIIDA